MTFDCDVCGICCEHVIDNQAITSHDGICDHLDRYTKKCTIYNERHLICRVVDGYDLVKDKISENDYLNLNYACCKKLKEMYGAKQK